MVDNYPKFSDFLEEDVGLEGDKKKIDDVLNKEILVVGSRIGRSKYRDKDYLTLQFENGGDKYVVFAGSEVLMKQAQKYKDKMPFHTTIKKVNNYYTMS